MGWQQQLWMQAAAGAAQGGMAIGLQRLGLGYDYRKQFEQTRKLQDLQLYNEGRLMDIQNQKQYEMWLKTNYGAQKEQMLKAGINPGLMYGMSGGGGTTTGAGMPGAPSAMVPDPNTRGAGVMGLMQGAQLALLNAQKENIEADTKNKLAEIPVKGAQVPNIEQDTKNKEKQFSEIEARIQNIAQDTMKKVNEVEQLRIANKINDRSAEYQIMNMKYEAINELLTSGVIKEEEKLKISERLKNNQEIKSMIAKIEQEWKHLSIQEKEMQLKGIMNQVEQMNANDKSGAINFYYHDKNKIAKAIEQILNTK